MSVLACDRNGCDNVMCDRFSFQHNLYICDDCFEELVRLGPATDIRTFMDTTTKRADPTKASRAYFETYFPKKEYGW